LTPIGEFCTSIDMRKTRIGILGTGDVGRILGAGFASVGHDVKIGSRDPGSQKVKDWVALTGSHASAGTFAEAAEFAEVAVLATAWSGTKSALELATPANLAGKVVIDATNPLDFSGGFPPKLAITGEDSLGERVQRALPDAKVVKAFNTIGNHYFVDPSFREGQPTMLIAGDDEDAKRTVGDVLADFGWPDPVDIGGIEGSRELEAICIAWVKIGGARGAWDHGFKLLVG
jgi:8-hydroxy-5-deazaflavin:NADPH oxidoreductase